MAKPKDDRPLTAEETEQFIKEIEAKEVEELREWSTMAERALITLVEENRELRAQLEDLQALVESLLSGEPTE